jgi:hypothetical protein
MEALKLHLLTLGFVRFTSPDSMFLNNSKTHLSHALDNIPTPNALSILVNLAKQLGFFRL